MFLHREGKYSPQMVDNSRDYPTKDWINIQSNAPVHNVQLLYVAILLLASAVRFAGNPVENRCKAKVIMQDQTGFGSALRLDLHFSAGVLIGS